jgi:hypothetical protein
LLLLLVLLPGAPGTLTLRNGCIANMVLELQAVAGQGRPALREAAQDDNGYEYALSAHSEI